MQLNIKHEQQDQQFTVSLNNEEAELAYALPEPDLMDFQHTYVPPSLEGRGIGSRLIQYGLQYARDNEFRVRASCDAVQRYLSKHPEFKDLLT